MGAMIVFEADFLHEWTTLQKHYLDCVVRYFTPYFGIIDALISFNG